MDLDPMITEGAPPAGFTIDGHGISTTLRYHKNTVGMWGYDSRNLFRVYLIMQGGLRGFRVGLNSIQYSSNEWISEDFVMLGVHWGSDRHQELCRSRLTTAPPRTVNLSPRRTPRTWSRREEHAQR